MAKPILGRGLSALLGGTAASGPPAAPAPAGVRRFRAVQRVPIARVRSSPLQPRQDFSAESLRELADSIKEQGIVQPLIVRLQDDHYELIAGERRWRAAQLIGLAEVPVIVRQADDRAALELALIENLQRENLNPIEEAGGYAQLIGQFDLTQEQAAAKVGKSRVVIANALRLLKLAPDLQACLREGRLSVGHAKAILGLASAEEQRLRRRPRPEEIPQRPPNRGTGRRPAKPARPGKPARRKAPSPPPPISPACKTGYSSASAPRSASVTIRAGAPWKSTSSATTISNAS